MSSVYIILNSQQLIGDIVEYTVFTLQYQYTVDHRPSSLKDGGETKSRVRVDLSGEQEAPSSITQCGAVWCSVVQCSLL